MCIFDVTTELRVILQCIDRDNRLIVVLKWVLVCGYLAADTVHTNTVKTNKGYVETVPKVTAHHHSAKAEVLSQFHLIYAHAAKRIDVLVNESSARGLL